VYQDIVLVMGIVTDIQSRPITTSECSRKSDAPLLLNPTPQGTRKHPDIGNQRQYTVTIMSLAGDKKTPRHWQSTPIYCNNHVSRKMAFSG